jgi:hypothetical protein
MRDRGTPKKEVRVRISHEPLTSEERAVAQETFLTTYATRGNVQAGCGAAGVGRTSIYRWLEHDEAFSTHYEQAKAKYCDRLRQEIDRRAANGVLKPVYYQGEKVGTIREYSDTLLIFQAKAKMPEYRDKVQVEQTGNVNVTLLATLRAVVEQAFPNDPEAAERIADAMAREKARDQDT